MIVLDEKYYIIGGDNSFNIATKGKNKEGKTVYVSQTYHKTIASALQYYIGMKQKEKINSKEYKNIKEAIEDLKKLDAEIRKKIEI
jgi:hypothetical protein